MIENFAEGIIIATVEGEIQFINQELCSFVISSIDCKNGKEDKVKLEQEGIRKKIFRCNYDEK